VKDILPVEDSEEGKLFAPFELFWLGDDVPILLLISTAQCL
jgi:hypothetical protein